MITVAVDVCMSPVIPQALNAVYSRDGYKFVRVSEIGGGPDTVWAAAFKRFGGSLVLSGDTKIATRPHEALAFLDSGFKCFFPDRTWPKLRVRLQIAYILHQWGVVHDRLKTLQGAGCWQLPIVFRDQRLTLREDLALKQLEIPKAVLDAERNRSVPQA